MKVYHPMISPSNSAETTTLPASFDDDDDSIVLDDNLQIAENNNNIMKNDIDSNSCGIPTQLDTMQSNNNNKQQPQKKKKKKLSLRKLKIIRTQWSSSHKSNSF